ncbi:MAG: PQQ-like beta-propeller repeat protein [Bacteroidia bacterium]|nr:PQQ-like beta-propeller repeat protein [Bacteroidia bacterium]
MPGLTGLAQNNDFPGWRGTNRDGKVTGFKAPANWPKELTKVWEVTVGLGDASPVLSNNKFYLLVKEGSNESLICLDAKDGKQIWKTDINPAPEITGPASSHPGPRSTPCISDGKVFSLGAKGVVACHDAKSGKLIWKNETYTTEVPQFFTGSSPLVTDKMVIIPLGGKTHGLVVAFDINNGKEIWKLEGAPCTYSSPLLMTIDKIILVNQSETDVLGISMDGKLLWKIPTPGQRMFYNAPTPVIDGQNIIIAGSGAGTKSVTMKKEGDNYTSTDVWANPKLGTSFNTPVLKDGYLYGNDGRFGFVFCLSAKTGETAWADTVKLNRFASTLDLGKSILSLTGNATMVIFEPSGKAYKELAKYKVSETEIYAHPLAADNKIYIKDKEKLTCWEVK